MEERCGGFNTKFKVIEILGIRKTCSLLGTILNEHNRLCLVWLLESGFGEFDNFAIL